MVETCKFVCVLSGFQPPMEMNSVFPAFVFLLLSAILCSFVSTVYIENWLQKWNGWYSKYYGKVQVKLRVDSL